MASTARIDELKKKFDENPRRYFAPLANEFRKSGDIEQAIIICEEFLPQQPGHMSGHIVYGQALFEAGRLPESRTVFETALGLDPENLIALRHLGDIAKGQGDAAVARTWYMRVLDADPRNEEIQSLIETLSGAEPATAEEPVAELAVEPEASPLGVFGEEPAPAIMLESRLDLLHLDDSLAVTAPAGMPAIPSTPETAPADTAAADFIDGFSFQNLDSRSTPTAETPAVAEGLESTAFSAPEEPISGIADLDDSLDSGVPSFDPPAHRVAALDGLQGSGGVTHGNVDESRASHTMSSLDLDDGLGTPPQGDALLDAAEFDIPPSPPVEEAALEIPFELPPEVIAAEAELMDLPDPAPVAQPPFVTETMAELYLSQGFREQALAVYRQLADARPDDERLRARVAALAPELVDAGPSVREFLARMAARRPGVRAAAAKPPSADDFAEPESEFVAPVFDAAPEAAPDAAPEAAPDAAPEAAPDAAPDANPDVESQVAPVAPAIERAAAMRTPDGSIDALFSGRVAGSSDDTAAAALAQAFGGKPEELGALPGRAAHAAAGELSLDSVFRDGPARAARPSQSFSFDQFFQGARTSGSVPRTTGPQPRMPAEAPAAKPAERGAEDIEQFNSWLQGLKPK